MEGARVFGCRWGDEWPDTITLEDAAEEIDFDLFQGDDLGLILCKGEVPVSDLPVYDLGWLSEDDAEDRTGRLRDGLRSGGDHVPPVVVLPGERLRDGHHRVALAHEAGLTHVPAYVAR